jgi:hypothetical protein
VTLAAVLILLVCSVGAATAAPKSTATDDPVRQAATQAIEKLDLQVSLPHPETEPDDSSFWNFRLPSWLLYALAAIAIGIVAFYVLRMAPIWGADEDDGWGTTGDGFGDPGSAPAIGLAQADELAARGFFVEAMHLLLLHSLGEIRRRLKLEFADSLTSREILRRARLPDDVTATLRGIVTRVELSYFGGYPASQPDYESCRAGFEALSAVLGKAQPAGAGH